MASAESIADSVEVEVNVDLDIVDENVQSREQECNLGTCEGACSHQDFKTSESLEAQYSPSDANETLSNAEHDGQQDGEYEGCEGNEQVEGEYNECKEIVEALMENKQKNMDSEDEDEKEMDEEQEDSMTNYAESTNQTSDNGDSELGENIQDVLNKIEGMDECELEQMIDQLEAFELDDSDVSIPVSESTQRGSNDGTTTPSKSIVKTKKLNWEAKASTPGYMLSSISRLQNVDDICRARMAARERIQQKAQERIEATASKAKIEKERIKKEIQDKKKAEAAARANVVAAERERVIAAKKKQEEHLERLKKQMSERNRKEAVDKKKMMEEVENKRKELAKARMEALREKKPMNVGSTISKSSLIQTK
ncbi:hypothetical protein BEWA_050110 [Theileria equi strain WA]|uniref:Uncharacterized protein n=1 Tax=Theileria equi strain WA TaxID=1537102 RepID=L1LBJ2_THEEQ|nr:hypothetical protein BEWA_050110 [Theileria equi strain WA]EKX72543.1 hypothetical protein BEWA_050110 [Theileria equi strain WA]|eukprot:XP_004831995.1 hypothetical protein BEWA_050110 [Theileria equi strain WA]